VSLVFNGAYTLDGLPIDPQGWCEGCLGVVSDNPGFGVQANNGLFVWNKHGEPSESDCARALSSAADTFAILPPFPSGPVGAGELKVDGWLCAFSNEGKLLRLQYKGRTAPGPDFEFRVTAWGLAKPV
jgi:hypothetical protein